MKALVVYESLWGNTAAIAAAIAEGIGPHARAVHTGEVDPGDVRHANLLVVGAPVHAFGLPTEATKHSVDARPVPNGAITPDTHQPTLRSWLENAPITEGVAAAFDTRIKGPLGHGGASKIEKLLIARGRTIAAPSMGFYVKNDKAPSAPASMLIKGEIERAREWGESLASHVEQ